jgi:hypothetical protein
MAMKVAIVVLAVLAFVAFYFAFCTPVPSFGT